MAYELKTLPYDYGALEPYIDKRTMETHHTKHHRAYIDKLNIALDKYDKLKKKSVEELIKDLNSIPDDIRIAVKNNGGGHVNHSFFWLILKKGVKPKGEILEAIEKNFGGFDKFKEEFVNAAVGVFGSGWVWLVLNKGKLEIMKTANQDSPLSEGKTPILCIDVWEHAYYLKYQNRRNEYVEAFFNIINWDKVNENFENANNW